MRTRPSAVIYLYGNDNHIADMVLQRTPFMDNRQLAFEYGANLNMQHVENGQEPFCDWDASEQEQTWCE